MSIRCRLYPTEEQEATLNLHCSHARFVYNLGLEQANFYKRHWGSTPQHVERCRQLAELRSELDWLKNGSSVVQQQASKDLQQAFENWWQNPGHFGRPTWRKRGHHEGFRIVNLLARKLNSKWGLVRVDKVGWVKFRYSRSWADIAATKSARFKQTKSGKWYVSFLSKQEPFEKNYTGTKVGMDFGVAHTVTTSDGKHCDMPNLLTKKEKERRLRLQRKLARQEMGSNQRNNTKRKIALSYELEALRRKDWIEKTTTNFVKDYDFIVLEDLKIKNMTKKAKAKPDPNNPGKWLRNNARAKSGLNKAILNQGWGEFRKRLEDKAGAATNPVQIVRTHAVFTSQTCNRCTYKHENNRENQATFSCQKCNHQANADVNAAQNILEKGTLEFEQALRELYEATNAAGHAVSGRGDLRKPKPSGKVAVNEASTTKELAHV